MVCGMDHLVRFFLDVVQPNPFPSDLLKRLMPGVLNDDDIPAILKYEAGFLVCLVIGMLYIVLMPLVGICLARSKTSQPQGNRARLYWGAYLAVMALILVGNICLYISSVSLKMHVDSITTEITSALDNLQNYVGTLLKGTQEAVDSCAQLLDHKVDSAGQELGGRVETALHLTNIKEYAENMSKFDMTTELHDFIASGGTDVEILRGFQSKIVENAKKLLRELKDTDLREQINNITSSNKNFDEMGEQVSSATRDSLKRANDTVNTAVDEMKKTTNTFTPMVKEAGYIIWAVGAALCCVVVLVIARNLLGLLVSSRGVGPVISFLLCSLLMLAVVLLFQLGGHCYTLVCRPWENGQLFRFIDSQVNVSDILQQETDLNLTSVYDDCTNGTSLWHALHIQDVVDLNRMLAMPPALTKDMFTRAIGNMDFTSSMDITASIEKIADITKQLDRILESAESPHALIDATNGLKSQVLKVNDTLTQLKSIEPQGGINNTIDGIVEDYFQSFTEDLIEEFISKIQVLKCVAVAKEVDNARSSLCGKMVMSVNTFWFCLGMCLIFFILAIMLSTRLAKYYIVEEIAPIEPDLGKSDASRERDQLKSLRKKAIDQFKELNKYSNMPYVETDYYD